ncbi:phosphoadenosine phosphosulfate reductase family protein, partial [Enterobacter hormaechei]|uniref:phosphoadenosine phosphosulfate reductase domain-containing protein n=1 Tax=Enterobacter hormaechei TaxID=158836 RepID=UPI001F0B380E
WEQGYLSVGDTHTTQKWEPGMSEEETRFFGLKRIDWDNRKIYQYLTEHGLSYHPLWEQGYLSVGDTHTTQKWEPGMSEEETRFFGLKR